MLAPFAGQSAAPADRSVASVPCLRWSSTAGLSARPEEVVAEAALSLEITYPRGATSVLKTLGITMRTPGQDEELALGFLLGEGVITSAADVLSTEAIPHNHAGERIDTCRTVLSRPPRNDLLRVSRAITTTSACGLCGRATLEGLPLDRPQVPSEAVTLPCDLIASLPGRLQAHQTTFKKTGGCHAAGLSTFAGEILLCREDVGRHNAVDKLFGRALLDRLPLSDVVLILSGRASFELVQKSASAGVGVAVAVGAPSSAAIDLATAAGITLIGFTRDNRFNVYTHATRVALP